MHRQCTQGNFYLPFFRERRGAAHHLNGPHGAFFSRKRAAVETQTAVSLNLHLHGCNERLYLLQVRHSCQTQPCGPNKKRENETMLGATPHAVRAVSRTFIPVICFFFLFSCPLALKTEGLLLHFCVSNAAHFSAQKTVTVHASHA